MALKDFTYEMVGPNEDLPCKFFIFEGKNGNYRRANHWHQSVEIFLVLEGELRFYINNQSQPLSAGELIIVNSNEIHSIHAPRKNETVVLQIPLKQFEKYFTAQRFIRFTSAARVRIRSPRLRITGSWHFLLRSFIRCTVPVKKDGSTGLWHCTTIFCT